MEEELLINENSMATTMRFINEYCQEFKRIYKEKLQQNNHKASGNLINNIQTEIKVDGYSFKVTAHLEDYYEYLENGREQGTPPPVSAILKWAQAKGLPTGNSSLPVQKSFAFAVAKSIGKLGTLKQYGYHKRGGKYLATTIEELNARYIPLIREALEEDFGNIAIRTFESVTGGKIKLANQQ